MTLLSAALQPRALLIAVHVPFIAFAVVHGLTGFGGDPHGLVWGAAPAALTAGAIQVWHSLSTSRGVRPAYWQWSLGALMALAATGAIAFPLLRGVLLHWFVIASFLELLAPPLGVLAAIADSIAVSIWASTFQYQSTGVAGAAWQFSYQIVIMLGGAAGLYGAARLVWHAEELRASRAQLAELAGDHERVRISRDLHDLLGQSLSAVALKGDLAQGLLARKDVPGASAELASLVSVARSALRDVRTIAHRGPAVSLAAELQSGADVLSAVGIDTHIDQSDRTLPQKVDELFAWAVREGVTNVLHHSSATTCSVAVARRDGMFTLEIENNGAGLPSSVGHGLRGLAARAGALAGRARGQALMGGRFVLTVEVPDLGGRIAGAA